MGILSFFRRTKSAQEPRERKKPSSPGSETPVVKAAGRDDVPKRDRGSADAALGVSMPFRVLLGPRETEKATLAAGQGRYTFLVERTATKSDIRKAVEKQFHVRVAGVHVVNVRGKIRRRGNIEGRVPGHRKAVVALRAGERIDLFSSATPGS